MYVHQWYLLQCSILSVTLLPQKICINPFFNILKFPTVYTTAWITKSFSQNLLQTLKISFYFYCLLTNSINYMWFYSYSNSFFYLGCFITISFSLLRCQTLLKQYTDCNFVNKICKHIIQRMKVLKQRKNELILDFHFFLLFIHSLYLERTAIFFNNIFNFSGILIFILFLENIPNRSETKQSM